MKKEKLKRFSAGLEKFLKSKRVYTKACNNFGNDQSILSSKGMAMTVPEICRWSMTPEGYGFWNEIHVEYERTRKVA